jgi:hypothetical protein
MNADAIVGRTLSLADALLRKAYLCDLIRSVSVPELARALDAVCARAEQAEVSAREVLVSLVDALNAPELAEKVQRLREEAAGEALLALERLTRQPVAGSRGRLGDPANDRVPDYGMGRPLTLGERKSLARRPDRDMMERLLADPHPDVIRRLLRNPRLTEDNVVRLAAKRPCRSDVLAEVARAPRWSHRPRIRLALVLNPDTPVDISAGITGLLVRQELRLVSESTQVPSAIRALCLEHLERRPPVELDEEGAPVH